MAVLSLLSRRYERVLLPGRVPCSLPLTTNTFTFLTELDMGKPLADKTLLFFFRFRHRLNLCFDHRITLCPRVAQPSFKTYFQNLLHHIPTRHPLRNHYYDQKWYSRWKLAFVPMSIWNGLVLSFHSMENLPPPRIDVLFGPHLTLRPSTTPRSYALLVSLYTPNGVLSTPNLRTCPAHCVTNTNAPRELFVGPVLL